MANPCLKSLALLDSGFSKLTGMAFDREKRCTYGISTCIFQYFHCYIFAADAFT